MSSNDSVDDRAPAHATAHAETTAVTTTVLMHSVLICLLPFSPDAGDCDGEAERLPAYGLAFSPPFADHPAHWIANCRIRSRLRDSARLSQDFRFPLRGK